MSEPPDPAISPWPSFDIALYYEWIGRIASLWSMLENTIDETIWQLAKVEDDAGACLTARLQGARSRLIALESLVRLRGKDKDLIKAIDVFAKKADRTAIRRNRAIHDAVVYYGLGREIVRWRIVAERKLDKGTAPADLSWYRKTALEIGSLIDDYQLLNAAIFAKFPAYSRRRP